MPSRSFEYNYLRQHLPESIAMRLRTAYKMRGEVRVRILLKHEPGEHYLVYPASMPIDAIIARICLECP